MIISDKDRAAAAAGAAAAEGAAAAAAAGAAWLRLRQGQLERNLSLFIDRYCV